MKSSKNHRMPNSEWTYRLVESESTNKSPILIKLCIECRYCSYFRLRAKWHWTCLRISPCQPMDSLCEHFEE